MRYEKVGRSKEQFFEIVLDAARVWVAKGSRAKGATKWTIKDSDERTYGWSGDLAKAKTFYAEQRAKLEADKFIAVGDATPRIDARRARDRADRALNKAGAAITRFDEGDAEALTDARAAVSEWDAAIATMDEDDRKGFLRLYGPEIKRTRALLERHAP